MERVAIIGLGLMGGSLGLALKARGFSGVIAGHTRSPERLALARTRGAVDVAAPNPASAAADADLVILCGPILSIPGLLRDCGPGLKPGAVVTDVGSTKEYLVHDLEPLARERNAHFVGSHPIAGSEQQGIQAARADLYEGAVVVVTPTDNSEESAVRRVEALWKSVGSAVCRMPPEEHDRLIARTSHLPHLAAALLTATVGRMPPLERTAMLCGSGFRDTSRVAEGAPEIWRDILETNREAVQVELAALRAELDQLARWLERGEFARVEEFLERSRGLRRGLLNRPM